MFVRGSAVIEILFVYDIIGTLISVYCDNLNILTRLISSQ